LSDACAIAVGAVSALGIGEAAYRAFRPGEPAPRAIGVDPVLSAAGLKRPFAARAPVRLTGPAAPLPGNACTDAPRDRATELLVCALSQVVLQLDLLRPGWRNERIGLAIGTSSGGMLSAEQFFAARAAGNEDRCLARRATYFAPLDDALAALGFEPLSLRPHVQILAACAASTIAIGKGLRWLDRGACDLVLAGGYDGVSTFVAAGFEALRATTASMPRPFRIGRDGMSLGEGAGVLALVGEGNTRGSRVVLRVAGFGASTDAVHITAPDRTGGGLARAARAALADSGLPASRIGLISAHATATPFNDAMEARAIASICGDAGSPSPVPPPIVHPFKAQIGHTLGAAGVLETLAIADAMASSCAPAAAGGGDLDPDAAVRLLDRSERCEAEAALKLSAAFGGANAALVVSASPSGRRPRPIRPVFARAFAHVESVDLPQLSDATAVPRDRLARLDTCCRLGLAAVAALAEKVGRAALEGAGIVAGHALATLDTNAQFYARLSARGPGGVDPRLFPATSPNAVAGECAIVYRMTGPSFAVGAGLGGAIEALGCGAELVASGDADRIVVLATDDAGPAGHDLLRWAGWTDRAWKQGAVAVCLDASPDGALCEVSPDVQPLAPTLPAGHLALIKWLVRDK
jgi:3-oxoacyl-[acyl-carrier-protein] synthase-1/3-oxoacyl-[acyl-carrier-protein] synthase II